MSKATRRFVAGEKNTAATTLGHEASGMDHTEVRSFLGHGYRLDLGSVPGAIVLRREDGTEVSRFRVRDATSEAIEQAAQEDQRTNQNQKV
jgi:hypothetical protein